MSDFHKKFKQHNMLALKCWPWQAERYVTLKVTNSFEEDQKSAKEELEISQHISKVQSAHKGRAFVRLIEDSFSVTGPFGEHLILVFEPLREPLWALGRHLGFLGLPPILFKAYLLPVLLGLDFLHSECHVIHTDLKSDNFLVGFEDRSVLEDYVCKQEEDSPFFKEVDGHLVYESSPNFGAVRGMVRVLKISDFGAAVFGNVPTPHRHEIQPEQFCALEVLLQAGWTYGADIWNLGMVLWELLQDTSLLDGLGPGSDEYSREVHFAQMIGLLGPPPQKLLDRADRAALSSLYTAQGGFRYPQLIPSESFTFSDLTPSLQGEEKRLFIEFASRMLRWLPEERSTAKELCSDPWLTFKPKKNHRPEE
ncbi:MAG: hypothetical protein M4579_003329 [Chaenotheca gracillima]|nr:MAG: hypothetical protein M4579_003329 [Chaenotheca gracillima]